MQFQEKWTDLEKGSCPNHHIFKVQSAYDGCHCPSTINFTQCAFDTNDEAVVAVDNNGIAYYIDITGKPAYRKLGTVGLCTFITFNPKDRSELLIGLSSTNIKVLRINAINDFCLLTGHTSPPTNISFYKDYCLTASNKEVLIWQAKSYSKAHQLRLNAKTIVIKKAVFSSLGIVAVLYLTDIIQTWTFQQFDKDNKIDVEKHGLKNVKDFDFTKDGRAMIVCGLQNKILVFNTSRWEVLKSMEFHENFNGGKQILVVPLPLDGGANSITVVLTSDCLLKYFSLATSSIIENCCEVQPGIKRIEVSPKGCFLAFISKHGFLEITHLDKVLNVKLCSSSSSEKTTKSKVQKMAHSHKTQEQLKCVHDAVKEELNLDRLIPILKEFGEYPEKHRRLIWMTIMELPNNKKAYIDLSNKVPHEAMFKLLKNDPLLDKCKSSTLGTTISCLLHWCPALAECLFLPKLVMPLVNVFQKNPILGFESSLYVILNYCQKWFEYHPLPPLNILGMVENVLLEADPLLFNYFCEKGVTSTHYAWPLLQTLMSEVLGQEDWLILWDHLLSLQKPWYLLMCTVAYNIIYRKTITTRLQTMEDFQQFYSTKGHASVKSILKLAHKLDVDTPHRIHPRRYLKTGTVIIPNKGPYPPFLQFEFPHFLTDELRGLNLKKLKDKERRLRGFQLHAMELLEEKRLRAESENFVKQIHEMRLNELRKCYENQVLEDERLLEYTKKETEDLDPSNYLPDDMRWSDLSFSDRRSAFLKDFDRKRRKSKRKNCRLLQEQVDRLEFEVQNLLATLHTHRARSRLK
ncbi:hypothetical protein TSAR_007271 [Trichomalopsis sarcophagae]|uniref:Rab-GAP TBC domain-containing protein n=1 Tax=Trichomalopsis sarcophagae TaxID=543379 RepID=A0A232EZR5_9HYME|nr:hypothetical protein TSAR_007271 [Trichomalopsis sarcophagae]